MAPVVAVLRIGEIVLSVASPDMALAVRSLVEPVTVSDRMSARKLLLKNHLFPGSKLTSRLRSSRSFSSTMATSSRTNLHHGNLLLFIIYQHSLAAALQLANEGF